MDKIVFDFLIRWLALYKEWQDIYLNGANARTRTDGQMLNGIRNRMKWLLADMEEMGITLELLKKEACANRIEMEEMYMDFPPEMPENWMKEGIESIRKNAKKALAAYLSSDDYAYIKQQIAELQEGQYSSILRRVEREVGFVRQLKWAIEKEQLPVMKRCSDTVHYLAELKRTREYLMMCIDCMQPFK